MPRLLAATVGGANRSGAITVLITASNSAKGTTLRNFGSISNAGVVIFCPDSNMDSVRGLRVVARRNGGIYISKVRNGFSSTRGNMGTVFASRGTGTTLLGGKCMLSSTGSVG